MGHFKLVYQSYPLDLKVHEPRITLRGTSGSWPGQKLEEDYVGLNLEVKSPKFFFDPNNDPEDDVSQWLNPGLDTQWLKIPLKRFENRDYRSLQEIRADFQGEGTRNALTGEDWWEAPGLISTYSDEFFARAEISMRHHGGGTFLVQLSGTTQFNTAFDIAFSAPLTVKLVGYRNSSTTDDLLGWFDRFLRKDDFTFTRLQRGEDLYLDGAVK
ncbi:hypothetical protein [Agrobacterium rubi]|uniref:Uncharacterized protein n=1 Tax=Agrobacterium rubi TaxID=28099 RepID=A0AAE7R8L5_9HYPH|nr:hypothetical protein [Agrobacterium rubi]NTE89613.1 hypothetical protein [Agrobacterium rubi]NTF05537.1 hypothetical protein [Agrobacterium rubi]NTF39980.1 hypothetical protein [Agrobacterium rubi]OCJ44728.1 hypothetical protein A6U92_15850 [Agrobacterium rubi]QTG03828.1 hypothetical protein G6M88_25610 [Agrobacterium rubi]